MAAALSQPSGNGSDGAGGCPALVGGMRALHLPTGAGMPPGFQRKVLGGGGLVKMCGEDDRSKNPRGKQSWVIHC